MKLPISSNIRGYNALRGLALIIQDLLQVAEDLELAGLIWCPEIGDEICHKVDRRLISVLVDPQGLTPDELRSTYLWLPTVEQMVVQFEARQTVLSHAGMELSEKDLCYKTIIQAPIGEIESKAVTLRLSVAFALRDLLLSTDGSQSIN